MKSICIFAALLFAAHSGNAATIVHDYQLQNSLTDAFGGPSLTANGGTLSSAGYAFTNNLGLSLSGGLSDPGDYSIAMTFDFTDLKNYRKILDMHNRDLDAGFYSLHSGLVYYPVQAGFEGALVEGVSATVVLTRDASTHKLAAYVDGVLQFSQFDFASPAIFDGPGNVMYFFTDDTAVTSDAPSGAVQRIRIFDGALSAAEVGALDAPSSSAPEPASFVLLGGALTVLGLVRRRRTS